MAKFNLERFQCVFVRAFAGISLVLAVFVASIIATGDPASAQVRHADKNIALKDQLHELQSELKNIQMKMDALTHRLKADQNKGESNVREPDFPKNTKSVSTNTVTPKSRLEAQRLYDAAYASYLDNDFTSAEQKFSEFLKRYPQDRLIISAQVWLAEVYNKRGQHEKAARLFKQAHELQAKRGEPVTSDMSSAVLPQKPSMERLYSTRKRTREKLADTDLSIIGQDNLDDNAQAGTLQDFTVNVGDRIFFETDSYELTDHAFNILESQVDWFREYPEILITVEGHADERGTREYNLALGAARANAVKKFLIEEGIDSKRIRTISYGKERPVALCDNISCWAQNRRAVTKLDGEPSRSEKVLDYGNQDLSREIWGKPGNTHKVRHKFKERQYLDLELPSSEFPVAQK